MFQRMLGEDSALNPVPLYTPYSPYTPASVPGSIPSFIPGSAYSEYGPVSSGAYGKVIGANVVKERYVANSDENMEGMSMFAGHEAQGVGAEEEFGPEKPTAVQTVTQAAVDITGLQKNIIYAVGAGIVAYIAYMYYYGE